MWERNCPECGKEMTYTSKQGFTNAEEKSTVCHKCRVRKCSVCGSTEHDKSKCPEVDYSHREWTCHLCGRLVRSPTADLKDKQVAAGRGCTRCREAIASVTELPFDCPECGETVIVHYENVLERYKKRGHCDCVYRKGQRPKKVLQAQKEAKIRDNHTCQECGATVGDMHAHHVKQYSKHPELGADLDNIITLCLDCHIKKHPWMKDKKVF